MQSGDVGKDIIFISESRSTGGPGRRKDRSTANVRDRLVRGASTVLPTPTRHSEGAFIPRGATDKMCLHLLPIPRLELYDMLRAGIPAEQGTMKLSTGCGHFGRQSK